MFFSILYSKVEARATTNKANDLKFSKTSRPGIVNIVMYHTQNPPPSTYFSITQNNVKYLIHSSLEQNF